MSDLPSIIETIGTNIALKVGSATHALSSFAKKRGTIKNEERKKTLPFTIDEEDKIHPVIVLDNDLQQNEDGEFERADMKEYCDNLLNKIKPEIYALEH